MSTVAPRTPVSGETRFFTTQAEREQGMADDATLANVRVKHQLAADSWSILAARAAARSTSGRGESGGAAPDDAVSGLDDIAARPQPSIAS